MVDVLIPILEQGVKDGDFVCSNIEYTTRLFTFGIIHTIHSDMPEENTKEYFLSYLDFLKEMFVKVLEIKTPDKIGEGSKICIIKKEEALEIYLCFLFSFYTNE